MHSSPLGGGPWAQAVGTGPTCIHWAVLTSTWEFHRFLGGEGDPKQIPCWNVVRESCALWGSSVEALALESLLFALKAGACLNKKVLTGYCYVLSIVLRTFHVLFL